MAIYQGRKNKLEKKKKTKSQLGSEPRKTKLSEKEVRKEVRVEGGKKKNVVVSVQFANVAADGKTKKVKINSIEDNSANKDFKRERVLTMGGIIDTELGKAKITSRPSQEGIVNAVLIK